MSKTKLFFCGLIFFGIKSFGQTTADLDINNISAPLNAAGDLFWAQPNHKFETPKGSGLSTVYASNLWIGGYDQSNQLHLASQTYRQTGTDFWPGPLDSTTAYCQQSVSSSSQWNRVWKITKAQIDTFICAYITQSVPGYAIPASILDWPGNGDPTFHQAHYMAPFYDTNGDGYYNPYDKDYPLIKGDEAVYFIYNDNLQGAVHTQSGGQHLGVEIHGMAYAFNCPDSALSNTVFINYQIFNRSTVNYHNCFVGSWTDFDIGSPMDDYVGCDVMRQCYYGYNGTATDGNGGPGTFGTKLGAQAVVFLNGINADANDGIDNNKNCFVDEPGESDLMSKFMYFNNDATMQGNPNLPIDYYNYMSGKWRDFTPITYGGNGHNTGAPCSYMFPGNSDQQFGWGLGGDCSAAVPTSLWFDANTPSDVRGIASSGSFSLNAGETRSLDLAFVFARDYTGSGIQQSLNVMNARVDSIRSYFANGITPCSNYSCFTGIKEDQVDHNSISIYPNPASDILFISLSGKTKNAVGEIYDVTGKKMEDVKWNMEDGKIDVSSFANGLYFIRIVDGSKIYSKKFIKE